MNIHVGYTLGVSLQVVHVAGMMRAGSGADVLPVLFPRTLDLHQTTFAMGEAVAHLHRLWLNGQLKRSLGTDGVYRFGAA